LADSEIKETSQEDTNSRDWHIPPEANVRQRRFVSELLKGKTQSQAAVAAGYKADYASDLMKLPQVRGFLDKAMVKAGIDDLLIARKLREGLDAKTPPRKEGGKQYPDQFVRKQYIDLICKIRGDYAPDKSEHINKTINLTIDMGMLKALKDTRFLSAKEVDYLEAEIVRDNEVTVVGELVAGTGD
jgi:phage terminase small subunit